jgi:NAD(P)H-nitrite reductase
VDWKDLHVKGLICYCERVTKEDILLAINEGARTLEDIRGATGACTARECKTANPRGLCCANDIEEMLRYYVPLSEALRGRRF